MMFLIAQSDVLTLLESCTVVAKCTANFVDIKIRPKLESCCCPQIFMTLINTCSLLLCLVYLCQESGPNLPSLALYSMTKCSHILKLFSTICSLCLFFITDSKERVMCMQTIKHTCMYACRGCQPGVGLTIVCQSKFKSQLSSRELCIYFAIPLMPNCNLTIKDMYYILKCLKEPNFDRLK